MKAVCGSGGVAAGQRAVVTAGERWYGKRDSVVVVWGKRWVK